MKPAKKWIAAAAAAAMTLTSLPAAGPVMDVQAAGGVDQTVRLEPWKLGNVSVLVGQQDRLQRAADQPGGRTVLQ